jgi:ATP-dependent Zn protease
MTLCGEVAQRRAGWDRSEEYHRVRCGNDRKQWLSVLDAITETRADGVAMMREMISEAHRIIDAHWELLEELARELLQYRKLDEHEIKQIVGA